MNWPTAKEVAEKARLERVRQELEQKERERAIKRAVERAHVQLSFLLLLAAVFYELFRR